MTVTEDDIENLAFEAIDLYGWQMQTVVFMEELSELIKALAKFIRTNGGGLDAIYEEYADVLICMKQLEVILVDVDDDPADHLEREMVRKLKRLADKIAEDRMRAEGIASV